ncbi:MAG: isoprenylcysteine carboxylmethyltransferase family protein [Hydrocarboniphaga sp.]|uniref:methyltransferase family protein n=1 Tax=Hydrocarboniphaga sp. TaxID=2033016 RepID=UPI00261B66CB|nr:isoprenylcysteine carboxylmethyltransferase family protein [Hydrocarboniphaga sp.]MDB5972556.1 isoprenylcysteine carboxylmethyltransferase family protein [Hydrocarboniphaga sp.]
MEMIGRLGSVQKTRRLLLKLAGLPLVPLLLVTSSRWQDGGFIHESIEGIGLLLILTCLLGRAACTLYIGGRKCSELVTIGPYSMSRNPLYFYSLLGTLGAGLMFGSVVVGVFFGAIYLLVFDRLIRREERFLEASFPFTFPDYCASTPRWWPRLGNWRGVDEIVVRPRLVYNTLRDASVFVLMVPLFEGIEAVQQMGWLPVLVKLP